MYRQNRDVFISKGDTIKVECQDCKYKFKIPKSTKKTYLRKLDLNISFVIFCPRCNSTNIARV